MGMSKRGRRRRRGCNWRRRRRRCCKTDRNSVSLSTCLGEKTDPDTFFTDLSQYAGGQTGPGTGLRGRLEFKFFSFTTLYNVNRKNNRLSYLWQTAVA